MFAEKLDFLMKLTGARNSALGRAAHVDASTVSRLRVGKRELPKKQNFLPLMCDYFARNIITPYQKSSAADAIYAGRAWPDDNRRVSQIILAWLADNGDTRDGSDARPSTKLADFSFKETPYAQSEETAPDGGRYYGNDGKRAAVTRFLSNVIASGDPITLLLYSDEEMDWLNEDARFSGEWARLMREAIQNGSRIRIIHTIGRSLGEMLEGLRKWMGVYVTGAVEPYYCPKLRDGITRRTLFIAPAIAAVAASSVGDNTQGALNLYFDDPKAVKALEQEFSRYFEMCLPLMRIIPSKDMTLAKSLTDELMQARGDKIIIDEAPSRAMLRNSDKSYDIYEVITLLGKNRAPYLLSVAEDMNKYANYYAVITQSALLPDGMTLYHNTRAGTVITRTKGEPIAFAINEPGMTAAFNEYLLRRVAEAKNPAYRKSVMETLIKAAREP